MCYFRMSRHTNTETYSKKKIYRNEQTSSKAYISMGNNTIICKNHERKGRIFYHPQLQYWSKFVPDSMFCISKTLITVITQLSHNIYLNSIIVNFEGTDWGEVSRNTVQGWNFKKMIMVSGFSRKAENIYQFKVHGCVYQEYSKI
jgi:hypothetical protein